MPIQDGWTLRARFVDGGCHSFINKKSGAVVLASKDQMISNQVWRILIERVTINMVQEMSEEVVKIYAKETCWVPAGMGKYIPMQTGCEIKEEVLIEASDKTIPGLVLPDIVYSVKKKLGCTYVENHDPESIILKHGQTIES